MAQHPTEETLNLTRKFLGGELGTPGQSPAQGGRTVPPRQLPTRPPIGRPNASTQPIDFRNLNQVVFDAQNATEPINFRDLQTKVQNIIGGPAATPTRRDIPRIQQPLSDRFFNLPSPVNFARTPRGRSLLERILQLRGLR